MLVTNEIDNILHETKQLWYSYIYNMACTPLLHLGGRLKSLEKSLLAGGGGGQKFLFREGGGNFIGGWHLILS